MEIEIRRNLDISAKLQGDFSALAEMAPRLTAEQEKLLDEAERTIRGIREQIWAYLESNPHRDHNGDLITRETHEVGFDVDYMTDENECCWAYAKDWYVRPKKSEFEK